MAFFTMKEINKTLGGLFGENPAPQIIRLAFEFSQSREDVTQAAWLIAHDNNYDPARGPRLPYLWGTLRRKLGSV
jgi:hypothetical protein